MVRTRQEILKTLKDVKDLKQELAIIKKEQQFLLSDIKEHELRDKLLYFNNPDKQYLGDYGKWKNNLMQEELFTKFRQCVHYIYTYTGGNRIGKTFSLITTALSCIYGKYLWENIRGNNWIWKERNWKPPIRCRIIGQDWEKHVKSVLIPKMKELMPKSWDIYVKKNTVGVEAYYTFTFNGKEHGSIEIMSNKSESDLFEGWNGHFVGYDEPPSRPNRIACIRGLTDYVGIEFYSMTLLKEAWVDQEVINKCDDDGIPDPSVCNIHGTTHGNIGYGISKKGVDNFAKNLTADERLIRLEGVPSYKQGMILPFDKGVHLVETIYDISTDWIIDIAIDIHPSKPHYVNFLATNRHNFKYNIHEIVEHCDGEELGNLIMRYTQTKNLRVNRIVIDPLSKADSNNPNTTYEKIEKAVGRYGYYIESAGAFKSAKQDGILELNRLMKSENGVAAFFVCKHCKHTIRQLSGWIYEDKGEKKGEPSKTDDDTCENLYRLALVGTEYTPFGNQNEFINLDMERQQKNQTKSSVTGY